MREKHKDDIRKSVAHMEHIVESKVPVVGVFVLRSEDGWKAEEL